LSRILLIDDDPLQLRVREAVLRDAGMEVYVATTAESALALLKSQVGNSIGLVVTDHIMPGCSGAIFVRALREVKPEIPVMVVSGMPEAEDEYQDMDIVFRAKPFPPPQMIALARELLAKSERNGA
jgi:DNA-binding NtrC family response regulator